MSDKRIYRVSFQNTGKLYELYARSISDSELYGFIEVEELIFGERGGMLVDPAEEKLKAEFEGVKRTYIPVHAVVRIDEVSREGANKIVSLKDGEKVMPFPVSGIIPGGEKDRS